MSQRKVGLKLCAESSNSQLLESITDLIKIDVDEMHSKQQDKPKQKNYILSALVEARLMIDNLDRSLMTAQEKRLVREDLRVATDAFNNMSKLQVAEALKLAKYVRIILDIERNKRNEIAQHGITDLSDDELVNQCALIIAEKK